MTKTKLLSIMLMCILTAFFVSCDEEEDETPEETVVVNEDSIIPSSDSGRPNTYLGCIEIGSRVTSIEVWDHGQIDGDIVTIKANGNVLIDEQVLDGPSNPIYVEYDFGFNGFNYVNLFAHNLGDIAPNTCTIAINGVEFVLEANLEANGAIDVVVLGYGVDCSDSTAGSGGGGGGGGGQGSTDTGDIKFWIAQDFGCGPITVNVPGVGSSTITGFFDSGAPDCLNTSAGGNFDDLDEGTYSYSASCDNISWSGDFTITANSCLRFQLQ